MQKLGLRYELVSFCRNISLFFEKRFIGCLCSVGTHAISHSLNVNPFMPNDISRPLSFGRIYFRFKSCWVVCFLFIYILIEHSESIHGYPERTPPCVVWSGPVRFHKKDTRLRAIENNVFLRFFVVKSVFDSHISGVIYGPVSEASELYPFNI